MAIIEVKGISTHLSVRGQGAQKILFVHGAGGNGRHFMDVEPPQGWQLFAVDLPGHGKSDGEAKNDVFAYADWLSSCIEAIGGCDIVAGHSMGGAITMALALIRPKLLRGIILIGTGAKLSVSQSIMNLCQDGSVSRIEELLAQFAYGPVPSLEQIRQWHRTFGASSSHAYLQDFSACRQFDIRNRLSEIPLPSLIICGLEDKLTPFKYSEYLTAHLPDATLRGIPEAGHMVMLEQAEAFNRAVAEFCRRFS